MERQALEEPRQGLLLREATPERGCEGRLTQTRESEGRSPIPKHWSAEGRGKAVLRQLWGKARGAGCHPCASKPQKQSPKGRDVPTRARLLLGAPGPTQASVREGCCPHSQGALRGSRSAPGGFLQSPRPQSPHCGEWSHSGVSGPGPPAMCTAVLPSPHWRTLSRALNRRETPGQQVNPGRGYAAFEPLCRGQ